MIENAGIDYKELYLQMQSAVVALSKTLEEIQKENKNLKEENEYLKRKLFGTKSETSKSLGFEQLSLFDEAEAEANPDEEQFILEEVKFNKKKKYKGQLDDKLSKLPHIEVIMTLPESELVCPVCNSKLVPVGKKFVRHEIEFVPAKLKVRDVYTTTYECRKCRANGKSVMKSPGIPEPVIPHSYASAESVAFVMKQKFVNGVPLYRQESEWKQMGLDLSRTTMANWIIYSSEHWLKPLTDRMHEVLLESKHAHADETPVQVLNEPGKKATTKSYMWVYSSIKESSYPIRLFVYAPNRCGYNPQIFFNGFHGTVISDAYSGYNNIEGCVNAYCWAHARRKFRDSLPNDLENAENTLPIIAMNKIKKLFAIEKEIETLSPDKKVKIRQLKSKPLIDDFFSWCKSNQNATASAKLSRAFKYVLNHEEGLRQYLYDGYIPMTNSLDERVIRPFTTGRKNWLFSASVSGAESSANAYSIIETAKANGLDPYKYLTTIFTYLPSQDLIENPEIIDEFLPWSEFVQKNCK